MKTLPAWSLSRSASIQRSFYQQSFTSFYQMLEDEKQDAKRTILVEDRTQKLPSISQPILQRILNTNIEKMYPYKIRGGYFCLVRLEKSTPQNKTLVDKALMRARYLVLNSNMLRKERDSLKGNQNCVYDVFQERCLWKNVMINSQYLDNGDYIDKLTESAILNEFESKLRFFLINHLEEIICVDNLRKFSIVPFGSSVNGCGWNQSDLDIAIVSENSLRDLTSNNNINEGETTTRGEGRKILRTISSILKEVVPGIRDILPILNARVPIIKFESQFTSLSCDLSYQPSIHDSGIDIAHVLYKYCQMDERVIKMMVIVKIWAEIQEIVRKVVPGPYFSNFCLMMLVINFLQIRAPNPILPSISNLKLIKISPSILIDEFHTSYSTTPLDKTASPLELLKEFFYWLAKLDFANYGCSVIEGAILKKPFNDPVYIENPLQRDLNVSKNVSKRELLKLIFVAEHSYLLLKHKNHLSTIFVPFSKKEINVADYINDISDD